jgi:3-dehydroquinate synthetase
MINALGVTWGITPMGLASRLHVLIQRHFDYELPVTPSAQDLVEAVSRDKKVARGLMHFVLLLREGEFLIQARPLDEILTAEVSQVLCGGSALGELVFARR